MGICSDDLHQEALGEGFRGRIFYLEGCRLVAVEVSKYVKD